MKKKSVYHFSSSPSRDVFKILKSLKTVMYFRKTLNLTSLTEFCISSVSEFSVRKIIKSRIFQVALKHRKNENIKVEKVFLFFQTLQEEWKNNESSFFPVKNSLRIWRKMSYIIHSRRPKYGNVRFAERSQHRCSFRTFYSN